MKIQKGVRGLENFLSMANSGVMYLIAGVVILFVMLMAVVFFVKEDA